MSRLSASLVIAMLVAVTAAVGAPAGLSTCAPPGIRLSVGPLVSPATGEHRDVLVFTNTSPPMCSLRGSPMLVLLHGARALPFRYSYRGSVYVGRLRPRLVVLRSQAHAYVLVAKYRCDGRVIARADRVRVTLPGQRAPLTLALTGPGADELDYCARYPGDQPIDPGNRVALTPFEPTVRLALTPPS